MPPCSLFSTQRPEGPSWHVSQIISSFLAQNPRMTPGIQNKCQRLCYDLQGLQKMAPFLSTSSPTLRWFTPSQLYWPPAAPQGLRLVFPLYAMLSPQHPHGSLPRNRQVFYQRSPSQRGPPRKSYIKCYSSSHFRSSLLVLFFTFKQSKPTTSQYYIFHTSFLLLSWLSITNLTASNNINLLSYGSEDHESSELGQLLFSRSHMTKITGSWQDTLGKSVLNSFKLLQDSALHGCRNEISISFWVVSGKS